MALNPYSKELIQGFYSLARNLYICGYFKEAEKICLGLLAIGEKSTAVQLLLGAINIEQNNFSIAANYFRVASQDPLFFNSSRVGILVCFIGLKEDARAISLAEELNNDTMTFDPTLLHFFEYLKRNLYKQK